MAEKVIQHNSVGGVGFAGIDTSRVLHTLTTYNASWTATEDCWCNAGVGASSSAAAQVSVDGVVIANTWQPSTSSYNIATFCMFPVKKGQVVSTRNQSSTKYNVTFYGLAK